MIVLSIYVILKDIYLKIKSDIEISKDVIWILAGLISVFGTILVGIIVSNLLRPVFLTRYLFPVANIAWLLCGFVISKIKFKKILMLAMIILICNQCYADCKETIVGEDWLDVLIDETLEKTADIDEGDILLTNCEHIAWTVGECYYPEAEVVFIDWENITGLEEGIEYWMISWFAIRNEEQERLGAEGVDIQEIIAPGHMNTHEVYIYKFLQNAK